MSDKRLKTILGQIKNERRGGAPHELWAGRNRDILLMQVRNTLDRSAKRTLGGYARHFFNIFVPAETLALAGRAVGIFLLVLGTVAGGGLVSAEVYRGAAPGEPLYKVKTAMEKAQLALAPNEEYKTRLRAEFADRRIDELAKLAEASAERQAQAPAVLASFENEILALGQGLEKLRSEDPAGVAEVAKLLERKMAVYRNVLRKAGAVILPAYLPELAKAADLVDGAAIKAMAVIVDKHLEGDAQASRGVVVTKFEDRLNQAEAKVESAARKDGAQTAVAAKKAKEAIAEAKKLVKDEQYKAALTKMVEVAELAQEVEDAAVAAGLAPAQPDVAAGLVPATTNESSPAPTEPPAKPADGAAGSGSR